MLMKHIQEHGGNILAGAREMLWTKLMFEPFKEIWENRDYFGYNIRDENAPWYKQVWQTIAHSFGDLTPISVSSAQRDQQRRRPAGRRRRPGDDDLGGGPARARPIPARHRGGSDGDRGLHGQARAAVAAARHAD